MNPLLDINSLLADLETISDIAASGIISQREVQLEPGEDRPAAILYLDIAGFSELSLRLEPQQLSLLVDRSLRIFELTVKAQGGYCDKVIGDAALYVFLGHPNYPPACEAAARAALAIRQRAEQIDLSLQESGLSLAVRQGLSFGPVTRRRVGGEEQQLTVMGATVNVAQRLEATAEPGTIQATRMVLDRLGSAVDSELRGPVELKGFGVVEVHLINGLREDQPRLRGSGIRLSPIIGRGELLELLTARLSGWWSGGQDSEQRSGNRLLVLQGTAAVGKSRLSYEALEALAAEGSLARATAHCTPGGSTIAFAGEICRVAGLHPQGLVSRWKELCQLAEEKRGKEYAERAQRLLPLVALLAGSQETDTTGARQADPRSFLTNVKIALKTCIELAALEGSGRVCLVVEDLQWMDEQRDIVAHLLASVDSIKPLVVIGTARPDYVHIACCVLRPGAGALCEEEAEIVEIPPLGREAGRELMGSLLPGLSLPEHIEDELHEKAIGLPYYYEEFARMLLRRWLVEEQGGAFLFTREVGELSLPEDLRMLILSRLDTLPAAVKDLALRASVLGRRFAPDLLSGIENRLGILDEAELTRSLQTLLEQRILIEFEDALFFEHLLTHEAAYSAMLSRNRLLLHSVAADVLQSMYMPGSADEMTLLGELVRHNKAAGRWAAAHVNLCMMLSVITQGGDHYGWQQLLGEAREAYQQARRQDPLLPEQSMDELLPCGMQQAFIGELEEAEASFRLLIEMAKRAQEPGLEAKGLNELGALEFKSGNYDKSLGYHREALKISRQARLPRVEVSVIGNIANVLSNQGLLIEAQRYYEDALEMARELGDLRLQGRNLANLGLLALYRKDPHAARGYYEEALPLARRCGDKVGEQIRLGNLGNIYTNLREYEEARACYQQSLEIAEEVGYLRGTGSTTLYLADLEIACDNFTDAECLLQRAQQILEPLGDRLMLVHLHNAWTRVHLRHGRIGEAGEALARSEALVREMRVPPESLLGEASAKTRAIYEEQLAVQGTAQQQS